MRFDNLFGDERKVERYLNGRKTKSLEAEKRENYDRWPVCDSEESGTILYRKIA